MAKGNKNDEPWKQWGQNSLNSSNCFSNQGCHPCLILEARYHPFQYRKVQVVNLGSKVKAFSAALSLCSGFRSWCRLKCIVVFLLGFCFSRLQNTRELKFSAFFPVIMRAVAMKRSSNQPTPERQKYFLSETGIWHHKLWGQYCNPPLGCLLEGGLCEAWMEEGVWWSGALWLSSVSSEVGIV